MRQSTKKLEGFFADCRMTKWKVMRHGAIRTREGSKELCPLAYVTSCWGPAHAAEVLGISKRTARWIAGGADSRYNSHRKWLKRKLGMRA